MRKGTMVSFTNPAFRDDLSELVHEGPQRFTWNTV